MDLHGEDEPLAPPDATTTLRTIRDLDQRSIHLLLDFHPYLGYATTQRLVREMIDRRGCKVAVNNQAVVHQLLSAHAMVRIEKVYGTVFENILGEKVSTKPVDVVVNGPEREHPYFKALTRR